MNEFAIPPELPEGYQFGDKLSPGVQAQVDYWALLSMNKAVCRVEDPLIKDHPRDPHSDLLLDMTLNARTNGRWGEVKRILEG